MLDKRRISALLYIILCVIFLGFTVCAFLWLFGARFPPESTPTLVSASGYLLLYPGNTTYAYTNELPEDDETNLIDLKDFRFTLNHDACNRTQPPLLLTVIHSASNNFQKRQVIRETWAKDGNAQMVVLFFVGQTQESQKKLEWENEKYKDLIQGNFVDSYRNMTYKHTMALKWATYYCSSAKYVLKLDDDVWVHAEALLDFLKHALSPWGARRLLLCDIFASTRVKRSWRSKWRVSPSEYPGREYPDYCGGWAVLYSPDTAFLLYRQAQQEPYFWIDDVHITGVLARKLNLTHTSIHSLMLRRKDVRNLARDPSYYYRDFLFGPPNSPEQEIRFLHQLVNSKRT